MSLAIKDAFIKYKDWVSKNPQLTSDIESAVKWISYFFSGRLSDSNVLAELVYSISNLVVLFNDKIIIQAHSLQSSSKGDKLKTWLTILEYSEVFIEVSALKLWGDKGKWLIILLIQILKCLARFKLLIYHNVQIGQNPPIQPLERKKVCKENNLDNKGISKQAFRLESGRVIRTVNGTEPVQSRSWQPPELPVELNESPLNDKQLAGEALYIVKPLVHLGMSFLFSPRHWVPWMVALGIDSASLKLLENKGNSTLSQRQIVELNQRNIALLLYLLRSPFYEKHTKDKLNRLLIVLSDNLPLVGIVLRPLAKYIPRWQETYFYMWSK
uniref:Peroxisomal membrane protein PEX16 n=2 Tax=Clastoptera arizonana TaxID=38151 RepID=A0A1B6E1J0_9HEMI